jgi:LmbE family N-acetylglucosaminyl deacetylase/CheY-like chemotaxis protein
MPNRPSLKVLLLEDNKPFALLLTRYIRDSGHIVHVAEDIPEANALLQSNPYDIVLSDIELPSGASFAFLGEAKAAFPRLLMVVMTSQQRADYAVAALRLKADEYLFKPFTKEQLIERLEQLYLERTANTQRILAIGAHPDDVELGCGGALAAHVARGDQVHILTLSGGEAGGEQLERARESRRAAELLGAQLTLASLSDTHIAEGAATISVIENCIRSVQPHLIYTHSEKDGHQDHRNAFRATMVAARGVASVMAYQAPSCTVQFVPNRFIEIGPYLDTKQRAIAAFTSQASARPYMEPDLIRATARYWGKFAGFGLCEAFEVIKDGSG